MTREISEFGNIRISCALCDFVTESQWLDEAVRDLREHAKRAHGREMTDQEATAVLRGELEKSQAA